MICRLSEHVAYILWSLTYVDRLSINTSVGSMSELFLETFRLIFVFSVIAFQKGQFAESVARNTRNFAPKCQWYMTASLCSWVTWLSLLNVALCKVYLSVRNGMWCMPRVADNGLPPDLAFFTRFNLFLLRSLPSNIVRRNIAGRYNAHFDHVMYRLQPNYGPLSGPFAINDDLPSRILSGSVQVRSGIARLTSSGVKFDDRTFVDDIDTVICATG